MYCSETLKLYYGGLISGLEYILRRCVSKKDMNVCFEKFMESEYFYKYRAGDPHTELLYKERVLIEILKEGEDFDGLVTLQSEHSDLHLNLVNYYCAKLIVIMECAVDAVPFTERLKVNYAVVDSMIVDFLNQSNAESNCIYSNVSEVIEYCKSNDVNVMFTESSNSVGLITSNSIGKSVFKVNTRSQLKRHMTVDGLIAVLSQCPRKSQQLSGAEEFLSKNNIGAEAGVAN